VPEPQIFPDVHRETASRRLPHPRRASPLAHPFGPGVNLRSTKTLNLSVGYPYSADVGIGSYPATGFLDFDLPVRVLLPSCHTAHRSHPQPEATPSWVPGLYVRFAGQIKTFSPAQHASSVLRAVTQGRDSPH